MPRQYEPIKITVESDSDSTIKYEHPSFGTISVSRCTGQTALFGSDVDHQYYVRVQIKKAILRRNLCHNWIHDKDNIVTFYMSTFQWASFVSSIGMGNGTPITLNTIEKKAIPQADALDSRKAYLQEFHKTTENAATELKKLRETIEIGKMTKKLKYELLGILDHSIQQIGVNSAYILDSFNEHMEVIASEAKAEVEEHAKHLIQSTGLTVIAEQHKQLTIK